MKSVLLLLIAITCATAHADITNQSIYCSSESFTNFSAQIFSDPSGPGYYGLKNAEISEGGFRRAKLMCAGSRQLGGIKCIGFWNGHASDQVEVTIHQEEVWNIYMTYRPLSGDHVMVGRPWGCYIRGGAFTR